MKIVYIYPAIATKGGVERILVDKMNLSADETGYEVYLLTYNQGQHAVSFPLNDRVHHIDLKVCTYAQYHYRGLRRLWEGWKRERWLCQRMRQALKEIAPDVLVTTTSECLSLLFRLKGKTPLVVESHGGFDHLIDYPAMTWKHRWDIRHRYRLLRKAEAIVTLTARDAEKWQKNYPQVRVIPNVVHLNPTGCLTDVTQKRVIFVARLAEQKGIPELMAVWRIAHQRHPDWLLDMYGEGEQLEATKELAVSLNVEDVVCFHGNVSNDKILEAMRCHDIFLFTSDRHEGWGAVLNEAMSNGCAVVASDEIGAVPFLIEDKKNGLVFKSLNEDMLYKNVKDLIDDVALRKQISVNAYHTMRDVWSPRCAANNLIKLCYNLYNGVDYNPIVIGPCSKATPYYRK